MSRFEKIRRSLSSAKQKAGTIGKKSTQIKKTASGKTIRVNQNLTTRMKAKKDARARARAEYLATLPKSRVKRFFFRLHPKRLAKYWFSRDGGIMALKIVGISILVMSIFIAGVFAFFRKDLPKNITDLDACSLGQTIKFYDRTKTILLWSGAGDVDCRPVALADISPYLQKAVVASEDKKFYSHHGFDAAGTFRAAISNVRGRETQGGSTITQQYVKLSQLSSEKTISRKIKELILSVELDASYKKDEILQAYLNEIGFAYQYNGAEAAAQGLFNKPAKELTLDEAAILAAGIPSPDFYWVQDQEALKDRKNYVLDQMVITGAITSDEAEAAKKVDTLAKVVKTNNQYKDIKAPHFVLEALEQLKNDPRYDFGKDVNKLGLTVTTTIDMNLQKIAEESVANGFACVRGRYGSYGIDCLGNFDNAAFVAEDVSTGQVVAMVGSRDFNIPGYGQLNVATTPRSPGSSFKPYDYATLMKVSENWGAGSIFYDVKTDFGGGYRPEDYDGREPGGISMRYALGGSRNIPAIKAMYAAGIDNVHQTIKDLGLTDGITGCAGAPECDGILSTAIGDGGQVRLDQHVHAYATFARLGKNKEQTYILKVEDAKGKAIREWKDSDGTQAIDAQIAYIINDMLSDRNASYFRNSKGYRDEVTNGFEALDIPAGMKTGTTNNFDNGWLMGFTQKYAAGVWIGNHENRSSVGRGYENSTARIWGEFMRRAHETMAEKPGAWAKPEGIKTVGYDSGFYSLLKSKCTGAQLGNVCGYGQSDIYPSWYVAPKSGNGQKATIDTVSNLLATDCTPDLAKKEITGGFVTPEITSADPNYSRWLAPIVARYGSAGGVIPTDKDNVHKCSDTKPSVSISNSGSIVTATYTQGTHPLKTLNIKIDGQIAQSFDISSNGSTDYSVSISGTHDVQAEVIDTLLYSDSSSTITVTGSAPITLSYSETGPAGVNTRLDWDPVSGATIYEVYRNGSLLASTPSSNYVATGANANGSFYIRAKNGGGGYIGSQSNTVTR